MFQYADGPGWASHRSLTNDLGNETLRKDITDDITSGLTGTLAKLIIYWLPSMAFKVYNAAYYQMKPSFETQICYLCTVI